MRMLRIGGMPVRLWMMSECTAASQDRIAETIDLPFIDDPEIIGSWNSVDFVETIEQFEPGQKQFKDELFLKEKIFSEGGRTQSDVWIWTKGCIITHGDRTACHYLIQDMEGAAHLFYEWKSGDYTMRQEAPWYSVLKKVEASAQPYSI